MTLAVIVDCHDYECQTAMEEHVAVMVAVVVSQLLSW